MNQNNLGGQAAGGVGRCEHALGGLRARAAGREAETEMRAERRGGEDRGGRGGERQMGSVIVTDRPIDRPAGRPAGRQPDK